MLGGCLSRSVNPLPEIATESNSVKSLEISKAGMERATQHGGHYGELREVKSGFLLNQSTGQHPLLSNFHSFILLDALDLCRDNVFVWPDGDNNFF